MDEFSIILFFSTNNALWTARILKDSGLYYKMRPIPRHLSSDCGYCVQIKSIDRQAIETILKDRHVEWDRIELL